MKPQDKCKIDGTKACPQSDCHCRRIDLRTLTSLTGFTQAEIFPMYANLILDGAMNEEVIRVNELIIDRWGNAALILIKDKAWRLVKSVKKGCHLAKYL